MRNKKYKNNHCLKHVLILQTKIKKQINVRTDWTDCIEPPVLSPKCGNWVVTRSESASYSLRQWPGWQQGLLDVKIFGVKHQRYQQNTNEEAHFLTVDLEQLSSWLDLNVDFSHVHPELLLSLQQLIYFVLPAIESFQKRSHPGNAYAMTHDLWEDHCGAYSILAKNLGWRVDVSTSTSDVAP